MDQPKKNISCDNFLDNFYNCVSKTNDFIDCKTFLDNFNNCYINKKN
jgi:hypothetical protein